MIRKWVRAISRVIFWTYPRGTWQYDILCLVILAFIFLTPRAVFDGSVFSQKQEPEKLQEKQKQPPQTQALL